MIVYEQLLSQASAYKAIGDKELSDKTLRCYLQLVENMKPYDRIQLGVYTLPCSVKPNDVNVRMPLNWILLFKTGTRALLLSERCVDWDFYDGSGPLLGPAPDTTWETCDIRRNLNQTFYHKAFHPRVQKMILTSHIRTGDSSGHTALGGKDTRDKLFLLSREDIDCYIGTLGDRSVLRADIVMADKLGDAVDLDVEPQVWWLRSPGEEQSKVACVEWDGSINENGYDSSCDEVGIRPAMWVDFSLLEV